MKEEQEGLEKNYSVCRSKRVRSRVRIWTWRGRKSPGRRSRKRKH